MQNVYYNSESLGKAIFIADVESLARSDLDVLERELKSAISGIRAKMEEESDTDDFDWMHKLSYKLQICEQFTTRVKQVRDTHLSKIEIYHLSFFRQAVSAAIGPLHADQLYEKAKQDAYRQLNKESKS